VNEKIIRNNIPHERQKTFDNLVYIKKLSYDFYIPHCNLLIEFDGIQHYDPIEYYGGYEGLMKRRIRDQIKVNYSRDKNINLLRIHYNDRQNVDQILSNAISHITAGNRLFVTNGLDEDLKPKEDNVTDAKNPDTSVDIPRGIHTLTLNIIRSTDITLNIMK